MISAHQQELEQDESPKTPIVNGRSLKLMSRSELQALFKSYGLKGANAKTIDLIEALKEHMADELQDKVFDEAAQAAEPNSLQDYHHQQKEEQQQSEEHPSLHDVTGPLMVHVQEINQITEHVDALHLDSNNDNDVMVVEVESDNRDNIDISNIDDEQTVPPVEQVENLFENELISTDTLAHQNKSEFDEIKEWLQENQLEQVIPLCDVEEITKWSLIKKLNFDVLKRLGLTFGVILSLMDSIEIKFPEVKEQNIVVSFSELKLMVQEIMKSSTTKPITSSKSFGVSKIGASSSLLKNSSSQFSKSSSSTVNDKRPATTTNTTSLSSSTTSTATGSNQQGRVPSSLAKVKPRIDSNLRKDESYNTPTTSNIIPRSNSSGSMKENSLPKPPTSTSTTTTNTTSNSITGLKKPTSVHGSFKKPIESTLKPFFRDAKSSNHSTINASNTHMMKF